MNDQSNRAELRSDRRGLLRIAAAAIVGTVAGSLRGGATDAQAADGLNLVLGSAANNQATTKTLLTQSGPIPNDGAFVVDATSSADYGVKATGSRIGVFGSGEYGLYGEGTEVGGAFAGPAAAVNLVPSGSAGPPSGIFNAKGDIVVDLDGVMWLCTSGGTLPTSTWVPISGGSTQFLASPQRLLDTRGPDLNNPRPRYDAGSTHPIGVTNAGIGVPDNARAIVANLTVTATSSYGFLTAFPTGVARPITSNVNWGEAQTVANSATIKLGAGGQISLYVEHSDAHVIVDVAGYII
jgi:hypothetical protein